MLLFPHLRRKLATKLSGLVMLAVLLVLLALGVYFDTFLRDNFLEVTSKRMQHAYQRLAYNLTQIEEGLVEGAAFAAADERILASVDLINRYQDKTRYNTALIDEEKKTLAAELLDRVKLSLNSDIALYGQDGDLIAYSSKESGAYQCGYVSFASGRFQVHSKQENATEFQPGALPAHGNIHPAYTTAAAPDRAEFAPFITYQRLGELLSIKSHQDVFDNHLGHSIAHLEVSRILNADYYAQLSKEMDIQIAQSFEIARPQQAVALNRRVDFSALDVLQTADQYAGAMKKAITGGAVYFTVALDKALHNEVINSNRYRLLALWLLVASFILMLMRVLIHRGLALPLSQLMVQIRRIEQGNYVQLQPVRTGDELEEISISVNTLACAVGERERSLQRARDEQEYLSNHDALTGLPNRRFFSHRLEHALDLARRSHTELAVFFLDLDQFKLVNDTLGHHVGDQLLVQIGDRLRNSVRASDTLARIGGDEFTVLVENVRDLSEIELILDKYVGLFAEPFACDPHELTTTVSIGIARYPFDGTDCASLLRHADLAVYNAKESGRDKYRFFSGELSERANLRAAMIRALKTALRVGDQFHLAYQPKVHAITGKVVAAEALIRWKSPEFGPVSPMQFIPLAEETGQILPIGDWVIHQGCQDLARLLKAGVALEHLSMNVSNVQLRDHSFVRTLHQAIADNGLQANQIELEITESFIAKDLAQAITALNEFRAMGVQLAIDDFGTGYSSMSCLQKLPFTRIKIDKSFIDGLPHNHDSVSITHAILGLAKTFGLATTAEGVEHADQLRLLQQAGCDEIQGYYFAMPMGLDELIAFCRGDA